MEKAMYMGSHIKGLEWDLVYLLFVVAMESPPPPTDYWQHTTENIVIMSDSLPLENTMQIKIVNRRIKYIDTATIFSISFKRALLFYEFIANKT